MSDKPKSSLYLRVVSAVVLLPVVLFCIVVGGLPFIALTAIAFVLSLYEWVRMARLGNQFVRDVLFGIVYLVLCFAAFVSLRLFFFEGLGLVLILALCVWATDIGAYFSGKAIGGPKMAPTISPNKTIAGLCGGIVSSVAIVYFYIKHIGLYLTDSFNMVFTAMQGASLATIVTIGIVLALVGQVGDLFISMQKRRVQVKDTGNLIPGHGGILDRIDSLLLAAPAFLALLTVLFQWR